MRRVFGAMLLLLAVVGVGGLTMTVHADAGVLLAPIGLDVRTYGISIVPAFEDLQETPVPQGTPAPEERTYGGFRLDYIIALAVLGGLTILSMILGRTAKKNRKRR